VEWLKTELKITPKQMVDWLCLVGKDDIPSPHKIGEVTASQWLESYGSVVGIHDARESLTKLKRETIEAYVRKDYWLARDMHTLKKNLNIFWD
jgi:5'-3' exonuclease